MALIAMFWLMFSGVRSVTQPPGDPQCSHESSFLQKRLKLGDLGSPEQQRSGVGSASSEKLPDWIRLTFNSSGQVGKCKPVPAGLLEQKSALARLINASTDASTNASNNTGRMEGNDLKSGGESPFQIIYANGTALKCSESQIIVRNFEDDLVKETCCPSHSLACAGCRFYDNVSDECLDCQEGYVHQKGQCLACTNMAWEDALGRNCKKYEEDQLCAGGSAESPNIDQWASRGISGTTACCACGGGLRKPMPFSFPASLKMFPLGSEVLAFPEPRTAREYTTDCALHSINISFNGTTGQVGGVALSTEATEQTCVVTAFDRAHGLQSTAQLDLSFVDVAYPQKAFLAKAGATMTPRLSSNATFSSFSLRCTPDLPWLHISDSDGMVRVDSNVSLVPRLASCTVSAQKKWCAQEFDEAASSSVQLLQARALPAVEQGDDPSPPEVSSPADVTTETPGPVCSKELRQTELTIVVPNEATFLFLVHRDERSKALGGMILTAEEEVPEYSIVAGLTAKATLQNDPPAAYHVDCGTSSSFDTVTGALLLNGYEVFRITAKGKIIGTPSSGLMNSCSGQEARCKLQMQCSVYGVLPFTKGLIKTSFKVSVEDSVCWQKVNHRNFQLLDAKDAQQDGTLASCRAWCRRTMTCSSFVFSPEDGKCYSARTASLADANYIGTVNLKSRECSRFTRCLNVDANAAWLSGQYCPETLSDRGHPLFSKPGAIKSSNIWLQKVSPDRLWTQTLCTSNDSWMLRRHSTEDIVMDAEEDKPAVVELYGEVLLCIKEDVLYTAFEGDGNVSIKAAPGAVRAGTQVALVQPAVYSCPSPLTERVEYLKANNLPVDMEDEEVARKIFRFDDPASKKLQDDFSLGPCECVPSHYGHQFPVHEDVAETIPPGSGNVFVAPPQLVASGAIGCHASGLSKTIPDMSLNDCTLTARRQRLPFFWHGEQTGKQVCRLYSSCESLQLEHDSEGQLQALSYKQTCAIANPDMCWTNEKRREFLSGYITAAASGSGNPQKYEPCLHEPILRECDRLRMSGITGIQECGMCKFKKKKFLSKRKPFVDSWPSSTQLRVSCNQDKWRGVSRDGLALVPGISLTCIDGRWMDSDGRESMIHFSCEAAVRITDNKKDSLMAYEIASKANDWWELHYGKVIRSFNNKCLAPNHHESSDNSSAAEVSIHLDAELGHAAAMMNAEKLGKGFAQQIGLRSDGTLINPGRSDGEWGTCGDSCVFVRGAGELITSDFGTTFASADEKLSMSGEDLPQWWKLLYVAGAGTTTTTTTTTGLRTAHFYLRHYEQRRYLGLCGHASSSCKSADGRAHRSAAGYFSPGHSGLLWTFTEDKAIMQAKIDEPAWNDCDRKIVTDNVPANQRSYSSLWPHWHCQRPLLDDASGPTAWCSHHNHVNSWEQFDLGTEKLVVGVVTQGRRHVAQWVTRIRVKVSSGGGVWRDVDNGKIFHANTNWHSHKYNNFARPETARWVRIYVIGWHHHISMRSALRVSMCKDGSPYPKQMSIGQTGGLFLGMCGLGSCGGKSGIAGFTQKSNMPWQVQRADSYAVHLNQQGKNMWMGACWNQRTCGSAATTLVNAYGGKAGYTKWEIIYPNPVKADKLQTDIGVKFAKVLSGYSKAGCMALLGQEICDGGAAVKYAAYQANGLCRINPDVYPHAANKHSAKVVAAWYYGDYDSCLLTPYRTHKDTNSWHADRNSSQSDCDFACDQDNKCKRSEFSRRDEGTCRLFACYDAYVCNTNGRMKHFGDLRSRWWMEQTGWWFSGWHWLDIRNHVIGDGTGFHRSTMGIRMQSEGTVQFILMNRHCTGHGRNTIDVLRNHVRIYRIHNECYKHKYTTFKVQAGDDVRITEDYAVIHLIRATFYCPGKPGANLLQTDVQGNVSELLLGEAAYGPSNASEENLSEFQIRNLSEAERRYTTMLENFSEDIGDLGAQDSAETINLAELQIQDSVLASFAGSSNSSSSAAEVSEQNLSDLQVQEVAGSEQSGKPCSDFACPTNYKLKENYQVITGDSVSACCDSLCSRFNCPLGTFTTGMSVRGTSAATCCQPCPGQTTRFSGEALEYCHFCPRDTSGPSKCSACPAGEYANEGAGCKACPCASGYNCSCKLDPYFSWSVDLTQTQATQLLIKLFFDGLDTSNCVVNSLPLGEATEESSGLWSYSIIVKVTVHIELRSLQATGCTGLREVSISNIEKAAWGSCRSAGSDTWLIKPLQSAPGFGHLQFLGSPGAPKCSDIRGIMQPCAEDEVDQLVDLAGLVPAVSQWTLSEHGEIEHVCGASETFCKPLKKASKGALSALASAGTLGDARNPASSRPVAFLTATGLKSAHGGWVNYYRAADAPYKASDCFKTSTPCHSAASQDLYHLEAHQVGCKSGYALQQYNLKTCNTGGKQGYQYEYSCCMIQGMGGCDQTYTPWADLTAQDALVTVSQQSLTCKENSVLNSFQLEAKDPGGSKAEIRYIHVCCEINPYPPISISAEAGALADSFGPFDGIYFPKKKVEGMVEMVSGFLYSTQKPASYTLDYDKINGTWCLQGEQMEQRCTVSSVPHPLQLFGNGPFDVTALKPMEAGNDKETSSGLQAIQIVKFPKPPAVKKIELKEQNLETFETSRELQGFDMQTVANWMPAPPMYKPYCALRDAKPWETQKDMEAEEQSGWGTLGRNQLDVLNTEENRERFKEASAVWHPCTHYLQDDSGVNRPDWSTGFDIMRLLNPSDIISLARKAKDTKDSIDSAFPSGNAMDDLGTPNTVAGNQAKNDRAIKRAEENDAESNRAFTKGDRDAEQAEADAEERQDNAFGIASSGLDAFRSEMEGLGATEATQPASKKGLTMEVEAACGARRSVRDQQNENDGKSSMQRQMAYDLVHLAASAICGALPQPEVVTAPLGVGAAMGVDAGAICETVTDTIHEGLSTFEEKWTAARDAWKFENDALDDDVCGDQIQGHMYKVMCDLHCIEDAVVKGNHAVLKSMKGLETHVVSTMQQMMLFYTTELFEKVKETQTQINSNDRGLSRMLTQYVKDLTDQNYEYAKKANKDIANFVIPPMQKLQGDLGIINGNLDIIFGWLKSNEILSPPSEDEDLLQTSAEETEPNTLADLHQSFKAASRATMDLVHGIHSGHAQAEGLDEDHMMPVMVKAAKSVTYNAFSALQSLMRGNQTEGQKHLDAVTRELQQARASTTTAKQSVKEAFARRSIVALAPARKHLRRETMTIGNVHIGLLGLTTTQRIIMKRAESFQELSDQNEFYAASNMLVQFDSAMMKIQRSLGEYLSMAKEYLQKRQAAIRELQDNLKVSQCGSEATVQVAQTRMAEMENAETQHLKILTGAFQDMAENLAHVADLLVNGGLLAHYLYLTASAVKLPTADTSASLPMRLAQAEAPLRGALLAGPGGFLGQVDQAFSLSQSLADMWMSEIKAPENDFRNLRGAWKNVQKAAKELDEQLQPKGALRKMLLLKVLEGQGDDLQKAFPVPAACRSKVSAKALLWQLETSDNSAVLLGSDGRHVRCQISSGEVMALGEKEVLGLESKEAKAEELGDFLRPWL